MPTNRTAPRFYLQVRDSFGRLGPLCRANGTVHTFDTEEEALRMAEAIGEGWASYRVATV